MTPVPPDWPVSLARRGAPATGGALTFARDFANGPTVSPVKPKFAPPKNSAKTKDRIKLPPQGPPHLPPLQAYPTAARPRGGGALIDTLDSQTIPGPTVAALPVGTRTRVRIDDKPYDPVGINIGSMLVTPFVTQSFGFDSNPDQTQTGVRPSAFSRTEGGVAAISQWSTNELKVDLRGGYNDYFQDPEANRPDATGVIDLRIDANRDTTIEAQQRFAIDTQRPGSPELNVNTVDRPLITTFGETLGATENFGRLSIGLHGSFDRTAYENAVLSDGTVEDLVEREFQRLRPAPAGRPTSSPPWSSLSWTSWWIAASTTPPWISAAMRAIRTASSARSDRPSSSIACSQANSRPATATARSRTPGYKDVSGPVVNGVLTYAVTPITLISLKAATTFDETTVQGASGAESRSVTLELAHQLLRNMTVTADLSYLNTHYIGAPIIENTWAETLKAEYHLSRSLVATATYNHEQLHSTSAGSGFSQDVFLVGLRVQR